MKSTPKQVKRYLYRELLSVKTVSIKAVCVILSLVIMSCCFYGCGNDEPQLYENENPSVRDSAVVSIPQSSINLGYSESSSFNPFFVTANLNYNIVSLMYQSLYKLDSSYVPYEQIASSVNYDGKKTAQIKIDTSILFSNGDNITSTDVVYSFNKAKKSDLYSLRLKNTVSFTAKGTDTVEVKLNSTDLYFKNVLTFPIVKYGTAENEKSIPVGSGMYVFKDKKLILNQKYKGNKPSVGTVNLKKIADSSTFALALESGTVDGIFDDLSSGSYTRVAANSKSVNLNNLVFLGINSDVGVLKLNAVRQAINFAVNRHNIAQNDFSNFASEAYTVFNPKWSEYFSSGVDETAYALNYTGASELLKSAGYSQCNLTLIVNSDNVFKCETANTVAENLKNANFNITVKQLAPSEFANALSNGSYDLYIGEMKFADNMDMSALFDTYGVSPSSVSKTAYSQFKDGTVAMLDFIGIFSEDLPFIPLVYRQGVFTYTRRITTELDSTYTDLFKNISEWTVSE